MGFLTEQVESRYSAEVAALDDKAFMNWGNNSYEDKEEFDWDIDTGELVIYDEMRDEIDRIHIDEVKEYI